jgi:hypothetical protein
MGRLSDGESRPSPKRTSWEKLWNFSCIEHGEDGKFTAMSEIISKVFVVGLLLVYAGLVMGFLLWNLGRWLRGSSGKKRAWLAILEHLSASRFFNRPYNAN